MIDLGSGVTLRYNAWAPDRKLNPHMAHLPDVEKYGATISHPKADGTVCEGAIAFDGPVQRELGEKNRWTVESWEPLTLSPSVLCRGCGFHGFIRNGKWVPA